jgi:tripartite-type tricarboxylate transporter receptor subunit TctC
MRLRLLTATLIAGLLIAPQVGDAQTYPNRPIRIIVPAPPGGVIDTATRLIQPSLEKALGQPIVVDNRGGATGAIGVEGAARADADGHTLLMIASTQTVNAAIRAKAPYDLVNDFAAIATVGKSPLIIVVHPSFKAETLQEFVETAKRAPGKFNNATPGVGTLAQLAMAAFSQRAGISLQDIPYRGGGPAMTAMLAGEAHLSMISPLPAAGHIRSGAVRALAITSLTRDPEFPDLPTIAESGFPGFEAVQWAGLLAPAKTPREIVQKLNAEVNRIIRDPELIKKLAVQGFAPAGGSPDDFARTIATDLMLWRKAAQAANIQVD